MKKIIYIGLLLFCMMSVQAEVVVLQSGQTVEGEILLQNEDIVMLRDAEGHKFQFPKDEVAEIRQPELSVQPSITEEIIDNSKGNCALRLDVSGGVAMVRSLGKGGYGSADIQIGSRFIGKKRVFLGGSVGYHAASANQLYQFLPLMVVVSVPLLSGKHAPEIGAGIGYGFSLKNPSRGGVVSRMDISWRYQYKTSSALLVGIQARWQQANVKYSEMVNNKEYYSTLGRNFVNVGLRLALEF